MDKVDIIFLWLFIGFMVILGISASIAWYAHWSNNTAYILTAILTVIYALVFRWIYKQHN